MQRGMAAVTLRLKKHDDRDRYFCHSMFATLQGEGLHVGKRAVFARLSGCNVWNGLDEHRERDALKNSVCASFCDTEFKGVRYDMGGNVFESPHQFARAARALWGSQAGEAFIVLTGGEPTLQVDGQLVSALRQEGFYVAIETNGTNRVPSGVHWTACAPKFPLPIVDAHYDEVKLLSCFLDKPEYVEAAEKLKATFRWVQPVDYGSSTSAERARTRAEIVKASAFVLNRAGWRMGNQSHKHWLLP